MKLSDLKPNHSIVTGHLTKLPRKSVAPKALTPTTADPEEVATPVHRETSVKMGIEARAMGYGCSFFCSSRRSVDVEEPKKDYPKPTT